MEFTLLCGKPRQPLFQIEHTNTRFIYDDGYTGTNFNRPGWQEVMELIESEQVGTLIVKDCCAIIGLNQKDLENTRLLA